MERDGMTEQQATNLIDECREAMLERGSDAPMEEILGLNLITLWTFYKGVTALKKILLAWIEQQLQFDSKLESLTYIEELKKSGRKFRIVSNKQDASGKVTLQIKKQYNNNAFPDE